MNYTNEFLQFSGEYEYKYYIRMGVLICYV